MFGSYLGEDVTRTGRVVTAHETGTKLAGREQQVDIVAANESLSHADDGAHERRFTVVVLSVLRHVSAKKSNHKQLLLPQYEVHKCRWVSDLAHKFVAALETITQKTHPASCATLISDLRLRLKQAYSTLRCDGLKPSISACCAGKRDRVTLLDVRGLHVHPTMEGRYHFQQRHRQ